MLLLLSSTTYLWDLYGIAIAFVVHSLDPSLFAQLITHYSFA